MIRKEYTHDAVVYNYFNARGKEREKYKRGTNIFYNAKRLYSFGTHYSLAVKCRNGYLLNSSYYSGTTSGHRYLVWRYVKDLIYADVPFDLLERLNVVLEKVRIVDQNNIGVLLSFSRKKYFCGYDKSKKSWHKDHFVARVSIFVNTVDEALCRLHKDIDLTHCQKMGDVFFEPCSELDTRSLVCNANYVLVHLPGVQSIRFCDDVSKNILKGFFEALPDEDHYILTDVYWHEDTPYIVFFDKAHAGMRIPENAVFQGNDLKIPVKLIKHHNFSGKSGLCYHARDAVCVSDQLFVRGTVRCKGHSMVRMGNVWHRVHFWNAFETVFN